jgi:UDP-glucose 4-epimerase
MVDAFGSACGRPVQTNYVSRRAGDLASYFANGDRAQARLGWQADLGLAEMCHDTWAWQSKNPEGFEDDRG